MGYNLRQNQAIWSPTCWIERPVVWQLWSKWPKLVQFSSFNHKENYRKVNGPQPKLTDFESKWYGSLAVTAFCVSRGTIWEKKSWGKLRFLIFFRFQAKKFRTLGKNFYSKLSKLRSTCSRELFGRKKLWEKYKLISFFRTVREITWDSVQELFSRVVASAVYVSRGLSWKKNNTLKNIWSSYFCRTMRQSFWVFDRIFFKRAIKTVFHVSRGTFWGLKIVNMFTPNYKIPEKKINLLKAWLLFRIILRWKIIKWQYMFRSREVYWTSFGDTWLFEGRKKTTKKG